MNFYSSKVFYTLFFGLFTLFDVSSAACDTCSELSYAACLNKTSYAVCFDGKTKSDQVNHCPENTICTDKQGICMPKDSADPGCDAFECNVCTPSSIFSCLSERNYGYCDSEGNILTVGECKEDEVCSIDYFTTEKAICGKKCNAKPTCSNTDYTTVAPTTASYEDTCKVAQADGCYPMAGDLTCSEFVCCETVDDQMTAVLGTCKSGFFNPVKQKCLNEKPNTCK